MFNVMGRLAYRWRWAILFVWVLATTVALPALPHVPEVLKAGGFSSPGIEAAQARDVLQRTLGFAPASIIVIYQSDGMKATDPGFRDAVSRSLVDVRHVPAVTDVVLPSREAGTISAGGDTAYVLIGLNLAPEEAQRLVPELEAALRPQPGLRMSIAGAPLFYRDIEDVSQRDLRRAELIVFPVALITLVVIFGSAVAALMPLLVGAAAVAMVLATIFFVAQVTDLSIFVLNLATMLGLGLAVDYSLFITSRFREELTNSAGDVAAAVERALATAGRAVFFSGATVLIGLAGLAMFDVVFLRSVGIVGVIVVAWSTLAALTLLPAVLSAMGARINRLSIRPFLRRHEQGNGFWIRLSRAVMRRPLVALVPTLVLLLLLGSPFLRANISSADATILPRDLPSRQALDLLVSGFGAGEISPFLIMLESQGRIFDADRLGAIYDLSARLARDPRVARVQSVTPAQLPKDQSLALATLQHRAGLLGVETGANRLANDDAAVIIAYSRFLPNDPRSRALLTDIRATAPPHFSTLVDGGTAEIVDSVQAMYADVPKAVALVVFATFLVLLLLFRSLVLPVKAILINALSIVASYGALVWVFQEGNLRGLLGFEPLGFVEASLPIIMFCVLFGLSMDYEVFLLSRIREEWERTGDNTSAVAVGMQRSGRIITSAALLVVVVTGSFVTADVVLIKALGFGIALAVALDATVVRALLVPATMRLLGEWNWWLPSPIRRLLTPNRQPQGATGTLGDW